MKSFDNIVLKYFDTVIPVKDWEWVTLSPKQENIHFLFVNEQYHILNAYAKIQNPIVEYFKMGDYFVYVSDELIEPYIGIFGKENENYCTELFIKWVEKNIPLDVTKTPYIGGKKREEVIGIS